MLSVVRYDKNCFLLKLLFLGRSNANAVNRADGVIGRGVFSKGYSAQARKVTVFPSIEVR